MDSRRSNSRSDRPEANSWPRTRPNKIQNGLPDATTTAPHSPILLGERKATRGQSPPVPTVGLPADRLDRPAPGSDRLPDGIHGQWRPGLGLYFLLPLFNNNRTVKIMKLL